MSTIIYCHRNKVNGKSYIGWTIKGLEKRWKEHCSASRLGAKTIFANALRKWGFTDDIWDHEIIEDNIVSIAVAKEAEKFWIADRKTNALRGCHGYNMTDGGDGIDGFKFSEASKNKMRRPHLNIRGKNHGMFGKPSAMRGKKHKTSSLQLMREKALARFSDPKEREKISGVNNGQFGKVGIESPAFGLRRSDLTRQEMSKSQVEKYENDPLYRKKRQGSKNGRAKITEEIALEIKQFLQSHSIIETSTKFDLSYVIVAKIAKGLTWKHILNKSAT